MGESLSKTLFFFFSSKFSNIFSALSDSKRFKILAIDSIDRRILEVIIDKFRGGPVGLSSIAAATGEEMGTIEEIYEPFLMQLGLIMRTPRGRVVTEEGYKHLNREIPADHQKKMM